MYVFHPCGSRRCLPGRASSQLARSAGDPERAERSEAAEVVGGGDEAARRLPRRQDLPERVQRLHPQLVRLHALIARYVCDEHASNAWLAWLKIKMNRRKRQTHTENASMHGDHTCLRMVPSEATLSMARATCMWPIPM